MQGFLNGASKWLGWQCLFSCSRQEDRPLVAGLLPRSRGSHLLPLPLCGLAWTPPDETQATRRPQSRPPCLQLRHGRPVGLHVPWGVREHWFLAGAANQSQGLSVFSLYPDQSSQGFFCVCVDVSGCFNSSWSRPGSPTTATSVSPWTTAPAL